MSDEIVLTLPRERRFYDVAHLVVSGLGARLNLTMDNLADLQLALDGLLPRRETGGDVTVVLRIHDELLDGQIGPFDTEAVAELERIGGDGYGTPVVLEGGIRQLPRGRRRRRGMGSLHEDDHAVAAGGRDVVAGHPTDKELLRAYHDNGDLSAREQLIERYMSLVRSLARRYSYRGEQLDDLIQIGAIGLIKAIDRFDLERGVELTTYATPNIIGEIKRHFRDRGWAVRVPRGLQELNVQLSRLMEQLTVQLERSPTVAELAKAANVEEEEVLEALESGRAYSSLSLSAGSSMGDDEEIDPLETIGTEEHEYELSENRAVLEPGFRVLDERERRILHLRFFEGLTQSQIAQQVGISQMHVSRLIRRSLEKIRDEIAADSEGIDEPPRRAATS